MKRVKSACIVQTLHFSLKDGIVGDYEKHVLKEEVRRYKEGLDKAGTKYRILLEEEQADGSIIIEIKKQYNSSPVGNYLD